MPEGKSSLWNAIRPEKEAKLDDWTSDEITLDEVERILIRGRLTCRVVWDLR